ncbi:MAG TPA: hypothetical protein VN608_00600 [Clostridia bacterium]|nr:hypothetical protein [Clostridia bacterium]
MKSNKVKTILDHPFFDFARKRGVLLSEEESAQIILEAHPSFAEMIESAKTRFSDENVSWEAFDEVLAARQKKAFEQSENVRSFPVRLKRLAAASLCLMLLLAFFVFVPRGRAAAVNLFDFVIDVIGDRAKLSNRSKEGNGNSAIWDNGETREYESFDAFHAETGFTPFILSTDWIKSVKITCTYRNGSGYTLLSSYTTSDGYNVQTNQIWGTSEDMILTNNGGSFDKSIVHDNYTMFYSIDKTDGKFAGILLMEHSVLHVTADPQVGISEMLAVIR